MITGPWLAPYISINAAGRQSPRQIRAEEQIVEPHPFVVRPAMAHVAPKGPGRMTLMGQKGIAPALIQQAPKRVPRLRLEKRVILPMMSGPDVRLGSDDIKVASEDDRHAGGQ